MSLTTILVAAAAMAVNFGWQKYDDGYEYLVQLEPETLRLLQDEGEVPIDSHVPKDVQPIRRVRIVVGRAELPREALTENEESRTDEPVERSANFRPEEAAPAANNRYPAQAAAPTTTLDAMVQPLRDVDNLLERGFEAGVDGLENTGQAIRGAVGNLSNGAQQQLQRTKETLVGPSPNANFPAASTPGYTPSGAVSTPNHGPPPAWQMEADAAVGSENSPLGNLGPPPLAGSEPAAASAADSNANGPTFPANREQPASENRGASVPIARSEGDSRMVPVPRIGSAPDSAAEEPPPWDWPPISSATTAPESTAPSTTWPASSSPSAPNDSATPAQLPASTGNPQPTTAAPSATPLEVPANASPANGQSLTGWFLAIIGLIGSLGLNFFLGVNYLDVRNKYRAALRRTSRGFGRPMVSA